MQNPSELAARIDRLEDRETIRQLVARYGFLVDNCDLEGVMQVFTPDGSFGSKDAVMNARGRAADYPKALASWRRDDRDQSGHNCASG